MQGEIRRLVDERAKRVEVDADWVVRRLVQNLQRAMQLVPVLDSEGNPIGEFRWSGAVANKALELLGMGMLTDRQEIAHSVPQSDNMLANLLAEIEATRQNQIIDAERVEAAVPGLEHAERQSMPVARPDLVLLGPQLARWMGIEIVASTYTRHERGAVGPVAEQGQDRDNEGFTTWTHETLRTVPGRR